MQVRQGLEGGRHGWSVRANLEGSRHLFAQYRLGLCRRGLHSSVGRGLHSSVGRWGNERTADAEKGATRVDDSVWEGTVRVIVATDMQQHHGGLEALAGSCPTECL